MHETRQPARVPFSQLLEAGLLRAGQTLILDHPPREATILPDGQLQSGEERGSIHQVGARLKGTPACNGWMHWRYLDPARPMAKFGSAAPPAARRRCVMTP